MVDPEQLELPFFVYQDELDKKYGADILPPCPICRSKLKWHTSYSDASCTNRNCMIVFSCGYSSTPGFTARKLKRADDCDHNLMTYAPYSDQFCTICGETFGPA